MYTIALGHVRQSLAAGPLSLNCTVELPPLLRGTALHTPLLGCYIFKITKGPLPLSPVGTCSKLHSDQEQTPCNVSLHSWFKR